MGKYNGTAAVVYVLLAGICWGVIGLFSRYLADSGFSSVQITFCRSAVTAAAIGAAVLYRRPAALRICKKDIWMFIGTGWCSIIFFNICYFTAIQLTTLSMAAILLYTAPSIVMVLSVLLFKETFTPGKAVCLVLSFTGCALVSGLGVGSLNIPGILAGLGAGFGYALYSIFGRYALLRYEPFTVTAWTFFMASVGLLGFCHIGEIGMLIEKTPSSLGAVVLLGLVSTALPFALYTEGLRMMEAGRASILASVEPLTSTLIGVAVFGEMLSFASICGIVCILLAIILLNRKTASADKFKTKFAARRNI